MAYKLGRYYIIISMASLELLAVGTTNPPENRINQSQQWKKGDNEPDFERQLSALYACPVYSWWHVQKTSCRHVQVQLQIELSLPRR
jgi:hypothetical protein